MSEKQELKPGGFGKAGFILGIVSLVLALSPLVSGWFLMLYWLYWITGILGLVLAVVAVVKHQKKGVAGIVLNVLAFVMPLLLAKTYEQKALDAASDAAEATFGIAREASKYASADFDYK